MLREKRHALILNRIRQDRLVSVAELSQRLEASYLIPCLDQPNLAVLTNGLHTSRLLYKLKHQDLQRNLNAMCSWGIMLLNSSKFGVRSLVQEMGLDEVTSWSPAQAPQTRPSTGCARPNHSQQRKT